MVQNLWTQLRRSTRAVHLVCEADALFPLTHRDLALSGLHGCRGHLLWGLCGRLLWGLHGRLPWGFGGDG